MTVIVTSIHVKWNGNLFGHKQKYIQKVIHKYRYGTCLEHVVGKIDLGWIDVTQISFAQLSG